MKSVILLVVLLVSLTTLVESSLAFRKRTSPQANDNLDLDEPKQYWRGCLHAHANWGPPQLPWTSPTVVEEWYREHQYNFAAITDLNYLTPVKGLQDVFDAPGRFITLPGIELSAEPLGVGIKIIDTLGVGVDNTLTFSGISTQVSGYASTVQVLESQSLDIRNAGGLPIVAHPGFTYAVTADDFLQMSRPHEPIFFEIYNGEPGMNFFGGGDKDSVETIWDKVLSTGRKMYAVATDDSHHFFDFIQSSRPDERVANPGRGWIQVRSSDLTWPLLRKAMKRGDFYATTGIKLIDYVSNNTGIFIKLDGTTRDLGWSVGANNPQLYTTAFIGRNGTTLKIDRSLTPSYVFLPSDLYVRAKIISSDGHIAWTQPTFV